MVVAIKGKKIVQAGGVITTTTWKKVTIPRMKIQACLQFFYAAFLSSSDLLVHHVCIILCPYFMIGLVALKLKAMETKPCTKVIAMARIKSKIVLKSMNMIMNWELVKI